MILHVDSLEEAVSKATSCPVCGGEDWVEWLQAPDRFHGRREFYQLVRCSSCSLVRIKNPPRPEELSNHYGETYNDSISTIGETDYLVRWRSRCEVIARYKSQGAILDLGCSSGAFLRAMKNKNWELYGIEFDPELAKRAGALSGASVFSGEVLAAPFAPNTFDVVTGFHVVEHLLNPKEAMAKIAQWLKPGGIVYLTVPNIQCWEARLFGSYWYGLELPRHLFHYSSRSLRHLALSAGLREVMVTTESGSYCERSYQYMVHEALRKIGIHRQPSSHSAQPLLPLRILRKAYRMTLGRTFAEVAAAMNGGVHVEAMFQKPKLEANSPRTPEIH